MPTICDFFDNKFIFAGLPHSSVIYCVLPKNKEVTYIAKITIEELYRREKYDIMGAVTAKALALGINERTDDGRT